MNREYEQFLAEEERLFKEWLAAEDAARQAEDAAKEKMERHVHEGGPEVTLEECYAALRLRATAARASAALIVHTRSRRI